MIKSQIQMWRDRLSERTAVTDGVSDSVQWLILTRLGVLCCLVTGMVLSQLLSREAIHPRNVVAAYALLTLGFLFNLGSAVTLSWLPRKAWVAAVNVVFDAALISAWVRVANGDASLFALLYLVHILLVSLVLYQRGAWAAALLACVGYGIAISSREGVAWNTWLIFSGIFLTVGVVGGYLSEELLRTTQSLRDKQQKIERLTYLHEKILNNLPTGLLTIDKDLRVNFVNPAGAHILGKTGEEIQGKGLSEVEPQLLPFFSSLDTEEVADDADEGGDPEQRVETTKAAVAGEARQIFVQTRSSSRPARLQQRVELGKGINRRIVRGDVADLDPAAGMGRLLAREAVGGRVLLFQDVTKLLHLEERLKQNEKLAAVGKLAAGIAHEIRNPLASMSASIEMLRDGIPKEVVGEENRKLMEIAVREIDRLNRLISEFLDFVKPERMKMDAVVLADLLADTVLSAKRSKDFQRVSEVVEAYDRSVVASGHGEKLRQVVWNLLLNAAQSMPKPAKITVGCARVSTARVKFWVEDEGQGMTEEVRNHLFEPFFTTKEKGTGLGLATAYKIVEAHHGEIRVESTWQRGTRFEIILNSQD